MHAFSGVWSVDGSGVVYVDANSSYLTYIQHGTHKVRQETADDCPAKDDPGIYMYNTVKSFIFPVSGVKITLYLNRSPHQASPKPPERETLIHKSASGALCGTKASFGSNRLREPHGG